MMGILQLKKSKFEHTDAVALSNGMDSVSNLVGVVGIGRGKYAVNLQWELAEEPNLAGRDARSRADTANIKAEYYCVREAATYQFGLGFERLGHRSAMPSLASLLASNLEGNWLGLFPLENGYYILGVQNEGIFAETDRYFALKEEAVGYFQEIQSLMDWDILYAPSEFRFAGTATVNLEDLLAGRNPVRLRRVNRWGKIGKLAMTGCIACIAIFVADSIFDNPVRKVIGLMPELPQNKEPAVSEEQTGKTEIPPMPWEDKLQGAAVLAGCVESIGSFASTVPGWTVSELICDGHNASARLKRNGEVGLGGGSATWILPYVRRPGFEPEVVLPRTGTGDLVEANWRLNPLPRISPDIRTVPVSIIRSALSHAFERRMTRVSLNETDESPFWQGVSFKFSTKVNPLGFGDILSAIPGIMIRSVHYGMEAGLWTIEGKAYEKLIPQNTRAD